MKTELKNRMKQSNSLMCSMLIGVFALFFTMQVTAQEKSEVKLNLPDGPYQFKGSCDFIVKDNQLYTPQEAIKKFGIPKLNEWFAGKKYKVLFSGEKVGEGFNKKIDDFYKPRRINACSNPFNIDRKKQNYLDDKKIIQGSLYGGDSNYGSAISLITVPDAYKETTRNVYRTISREEIGAVEGQIKKQLYAELSSQREMAQYKFNVEDMMFAELRMLDKISRHGKDMYVGVVYFGRGNLWNKSLVFSAHDMTVKFLTITNKLITIKGMLDVDGCGKDELIIEKMLIGEDRCISQLETFKQYDDGSWRVIVRSNKINCM